MRRIVDAEVRVFFVVVYTERVRECVWVCERRHSCEIVDAKS